MARKKAPAYTFLNRVAHFIADLPPCTPRQEFADMRLLQLGNRAWRRFVTNRPRTASLTLAAAHTVWGYLACTCNAKNSTASLVNADALSGVLATDDLANAVLRSLLVPEMEIPKPAKLKSKSRLTPASLLLLATHSAASDHISSILGVILLFQTALRSSRSLAADDEQKLLAALQKLLSLPETDIV